MNRLFDWHKAGLLVRSFFSIAALALGFGTALLVGYTQQLAQPAVVSASSGGGVHGTIALRVPDETARTASTVSAGHLLYVPDVEVFLQNVQTGETSDSVKTDFFGRFLFPRQKPGTYEVHWKQQAGWQE